MLIPRMGVRDPAISRAARSIVPSPPNTNKRSTSRESEAASGQSTASRSAMRAVLASAYSRRPDARTSRAARATIEAEESLPELPSSPTFLILSGVFFNQGQEFFVARRPQQRGLSETFPTKRVLRGHELFECPENPLVNGRIFDDAGSAVRFLFAG